MISDRKSAMSIDQITELLKKSPHWREDFRVVESAPYVYYVEADTQDSETILAIAQLDEVLKNNTSR